ncbi:Ig-like domain-containing protein, partial [Parabacteroides sp. OttesenSCG-928-N08]|nr:Ig-like domain-containing protein [Parabacteroides sp. OttesenSCG-928-N08]
GESFTLTATVLPENATNKAVSWKSSNTAVATVKEGVVTGGTATGTATITVTSEDGNKTASCIVTVEAINIPVTGITLNQTQQTMKPGESITLLPTIAPANASDKRVSWSTSDAQIATVDADGRVSAVAVGEATISATTVDGGKSAQCLITVQADPEEPDEEKIEIIPSPVGDGNSGQLIFALKIPDNVPFSGTFKLTLPEGMKLNIEACELSDDLESILKMKIATLINNSWRFTLSKKTLRSETAKQYKAILAIAYDINSELANGNYSAAISQVDLDFDDGSDIQVDLIEIPLVVDREETSIASATSPDVTLWIDNSHLFIESDRRERITVYSTSGKVIRIAEKREERLLITLPTSGWDIYLVKGGSGWSKMIRRR